MLKIVHRCLAGLADVTLYLLTLFCILGTLKALSSCMANGPEFCVDCMADAVPPIWINGLFVPMICVIGVLGIFKVMTAVSTSDRTR